jgi:uncharacterized membrane protein
MTWRHYVLIALLVAGLILTVVEIVALINHTPGDTISEIVREKSRNWPIIPFLLGAVMAHFFWTN